MNPTKILLEAPILTQSGYGEHSRLVYNSIKDLPGVEIYICPLVWGATSWVTDVDFLIENSIKNFHEYENFCKQTNTNPDYDIQIRVGIANEFEKRAKKSVLVTAGIETDRVSWSWIVKTHQGIDKIIVPSEHSKVSFDGTVYEAENRTNNTKTKVKCNCPVEVVPYPVKQLNHANLDIDFKTDFNFLNVGLFGVRKNIEQCIEWFIKEFKDDENVGLVLKTGVARGTQLDREITLKKINKMLEKHDDRKCKVYLVHGNMTDEEVHSLYIHPKIKALVTTTHGEGYGLPIFEAAYSGLPVVATDWSGHLDFLQGTVKKAGKEKKKKLFARVDYSLKEIQKEAIWEDILIEGSRWAYPEEVSFRRQISNVRKNYSLYKSWAKTLKEQLEESHKESAVFEKMRTAIGIQTSQEITDEIEAMFASLPQE